MIRLFTVLLLTGIFASILLFLKGNFLAHKIELKSPIADLNSTNTQSSGNSLWKPTETKVLASSTSKPELTALAAYIYDIASDKVIYEKNPRERLPIASLTKIMTAIIALESIRPEKEIPISQHAATVGEDSMGIAEGEVYTFEELLYGLVLHSGNDAAVAIAEGVSGNESDFVYKMNQKAKTLGLSDTFFINPSGLEEDPPLPHEYSTVYDLTILTKYALTFPLFAKVAATVEYDIPYTQQHKHIYLFNETNLLTTYPGVKGVKTGYTPSAGLCLVTYAENGGHKLIGILLNSQSRREEMRSLLDYSFTNLDVKITQR